MRELQGLSSRVSDWRRHGEDEDRVSASLHHCTRFDRTAADGRVFATVRTVGSTCFVAHESARRRARCGAPDRALAGTVGKTLIAALALALVSKLSAERHARRLGKRSRTACRY